MPISNADAEKVIRAYYSNNPETLKPCVSHYDIVVENVMHQIFQIKVEEERFLDVLEMIIEGSVSSIQKITKKTKNEVIDMANRLFS